MSTSAATAKGAATREVIVDRAYSIACLAGLEGLSIGVLAQSVGMSKSGVFAHFGSREDLQLAVLDDAGRRFLAHVLVPAVQLPRGLPRLRRIVAGWIDWVRHTTDGGCLFLGAVSEYDDRPGPQRDRLIQHQLRWREELARAIAMAVDTGELRADTDPMQLAFEIYGLVLVVHHDAGLFDREAAFANGLRAFDRLIDSYSS